MSRPTSHYTRHARARSQQRAIPPLIVQWLIEYGERTPSFGAIRLTFDKQARRAIARDNGKPVVSQLGRFLNASAVVDPSTDTIISVMWNR